MGRCSSSRMRAKCAQVARQVSRWRTSMHKQPCGPLRLPFDAARHVKKPMPRMQRWHLAARCISGKQCQCRVVLPKGFEHVSGMRLVDAATRPHQQLGRLEGIDDQKTDSVSMMRVRILTSRSLSSSLLVSSAQFTRSLFCRTRKDMGIPPWH